MELIKQQRQQQAASSQPTAASPSLSSLSGFTIPKNKPSSTSGTQPSDATQAQTGAKDRSQPSLGQSSPLANRGNRPDLSKNPSASQPSQFSLSKAEIEQRREQERQQRQLLSNQIDMNAPSELMAAFDPV